MRTIILSTFIDVVKKLCDSINFCNQDRSGSTRSLYFLRPSLMMIFIFKQTIYKNNKLIHIQKKITLSIHKKLSLKLFYFYSFDHFVIFKKWNIGRMRGPPLRSRLLFKTLIYCERNMNLYYPKVMYKKMKTQLELKNEFLVEQMERELFSFLNLKYTTHNIQISENELLHTIFLPTLCKEQQKCENYYIGHGFGGSSLMSFMFVESLLQKGNVIFWEIRGMGFSSKLKEYYYDQTQQIQRFFLNGIEAVILFYNHSNCSFICHSFSAYLLILFTIRFPTVSKSHIKILLLLSPIGITTKEDDYKNYIRSCSDVFHTIINKIGWAFNLTYKSPLRTICGCCKQSIIMKTIKNVEMSQPQKKMLYKLIETFILLPDGSETLFFKLFQPRVIPKVALDPLLTVNPMINILLVYGGQADWVDKNGAKRISERFPEHIRFINIENCGHNIPFDIAICRQLFQKFL